MIEEVIAAAHHAGHLIEGVRKAGFDVDHKSDHGPVTEADRAADRWLRGRLREIVPAGWLSEETADDPSRLTERTLWVVDPLDGTKEFVRGLPEYAVAIALVESGEPTLGVVHNPATGQTFWAERGGGAYANGGGRISTREGKRLLASRSELARGEFSSFAGEWQVEAKGSIQLKLALVAAGEAAATLSRGPKHEWDVCAGALLVVEAGGRATDVYGDPLLFNQPFPKVPGVLAGAPQAFERAQALVRSVGVSDRMKELGDPPSP